jgi:hypothetical protein
MADEAKETARKAPKGFDAVGYPNEVTGEVPTLYVCQTCHPPWDTFDQAEAEAHLTTEGHAEGTARTEARKARQAGV